MYRNRDRKRRVNDDFHRRDEKRQRKSQTHDSREHEKGPIDGYSSELARFLEEQFNIKSTQDFWRFYKKYSLAETAAATQRQSSTHDRSKFLVWQFEEPFALLYDRLPVLDKNGERLTIEREDFRKFLTAVRVYQDFQQKTKFAKLKKLRNSQRELPMARYKTEIIEKLASCRVMLIAGDTGCGKSTQVPQYVLGAGYKKIVCTQPRRIACISLAKRVAHESLTDYKSTVGYQIRFERSKRADTAIIFMTEGLLLRQAAEEETLGAYDVIILDEVHERHLHGDFLVGIMKCLLYKRNDFKLILMSATINLELFSNYFNKEGVQVIQVPGRLYPIDTIYKPIVKDPYERKSSKFDCTPYLQIIQMIDEKYLPHQKGDLLVFLNGFSEISTLVDAITDYAQHKKNWIVLPLHSSLSLEEQDKVFDYPPEGVRKAIISTNIAETSVTIDGVRFVIDSGKVNRMAYKGGFNKLSETTISRDSAKQRSGRAGRTGPGVCYRLYSEEDFGNFDAFTPAEIHLVPLESLLLHMISLGLSDLRNFPFLEKPSQKSMEESLDRLKFVGALELNQQELKLTLLGDALGQLPVDLAVGKMLVLSVVFGNVNAVLSLAALLSVQSPLTQQAYRNSEAQTLRGALYSTHGDPLTLLNYYKEWLSVKQGGEKSRIWARKRCLEEQRFYETTKLIEQFREILQEARLLPKIEGKTLSSGERAIRHGELRQLKSLRHSLKDEQKSGRRKILKYQMFSGEDGDREDETTDLRDVEFRIANDFKRLSRLLSEASADSHSHLMMLKLILASGFYPQVAVEDEFNSSKTVSERLYHTKTKNYVFLRPLSYFATNPEALQLHNDDIEVPPPGYFSKRPISMKHQILVYQTILETKKVYLVNAMRMPALQTLLLFAKTIATNATLTKFVFDDFLMIDAPHYGQGQSLLLKATRLRAQWKSQLEAKLANPDIEIDNRKVGEFVDEIVAFMASAVSYNVKRLLPADTKEIYTRTHHLKEIPISSNPFDQGFKIGPNQELGGLDVTENVVYNCIHQEDWAYDLEQQLIDTPFECPFCNVSQIGLAIFDRFCHEQIDCPALSKSKAGRVSSSPVENNTPLKPNSKLFACESCRKQMQLTPVEILRHKKSCINATVAAPSSSSQL